MAEVAGPGKFSKRTDRNAVQPAREMTGGAYGENKALMETQTSAPMSAAPAMAMPSMQLAGPTARPDEPITAGAPVGAGPGPEILPSAPQAPDDTAALLRQIAVLNPDPDLIRIVQFLDSEGR